MPDSTPTLDRPSVVVTPPAPRVDLDARARRTVLAWRLRRSVARRLVRL